MSRVWYTSDLHIGHKKVAGIRGFWNENDVSYEIRDTGFAIEEVAVCAEDTEEHDLVLAQNWDRLVKKTDIVYVLGDISFNGGQHALDWIEKRPGIKHLISGNHDPVGPWDRRAVSKQRHWLNYFETINPYLRRKLNGHNFLLSHFPYIEWGDGPERGEARYTQYRLLDEGLPLLHGHTHGKETAHGHELHVGVDAWDLELVSQEFVQDWLNDLYS